MLKMSKFAKLSPRQTFLLYSISLELLWKELLVFNLAQYVFNAS